MNKDTIINRRAFGRAVILFVITFCLTSESEAFLENKTSSDYTVIALIKNYYGSGTAHYYGAPSFRQWRVVIRIRKTNQGYLRVFPAEARDTFKMFTALDFTNFTYTEDVKNATYMEKFYPLNRYIETVCFVFNAFQTLSDKAKAQFGTNTFVGLEFMDQIGTDFTDTGQLVPTGDFRADTYDLRNLTESETKLNDKYDEFFLSQ